jgi:hypothetical protein
MIKRTATVMAVIAVLMTAMTAASQNLVPRKGYLHFVGTINKEIQVEMNLVKINDTLYGDYYFLSGGKMPFGKQVTGQGIPVCGKMSSGDAFRLKDFEVDKGSVFNGRFTGSQSVAGSFEAAPGAKSLPFELSEKYPEGSVSMSVFYQKAFTPLVKKPKSPVASIQLGLLLPGESANPLISDSLNKLMLEKFVGKTVRNLQPDKALEGIKQVYFETYLTNNEGIYNPEMEATFWWQSLKFTHILMNRSHVLTFYIDHYAFTGGAHGLQTRHYSVVNLWTGKEALLKDLFTPEAETRLSELLSEKIHALMNIPSAQSLKDAGFFTDTVAPSENFYITPAGIGFYYNQYDIAPYVMGSIDVFFPFGELKDLITSSGILREVVR